MNKEQFINLVTSHILEYLPEEYRDARVEVMERTKNNDTLLHGLIIHSGEKKDMEAAPIFYLEPYFKAYQFGEKDMEDVMHELARDYLQVIRNMPQFDLPDMTKEGVRDRVYVKLVNTRSNQDHLKDLVSLPVDGGFSLTVYIDMDTPKRDAMIQVTKELASRIDFDERELMQTAMRNTVQAHPAELTEMAKVMMDMSGLRKLEPGDNLLQDNCSPAGDLSMLILSNSDKFFGAAALFYPEVQVRIADVTGGSYYILPSSVHELIVLPDNGSLDERELARMVQSVNSYEVSPEEQLGNKVLYYNAAADRLMVAVDLDKEKARGHER
ncbi:MAG: hypothetical protein J5589_07845 [Firmicutes bacterium]|nr:hypothetical protein [Bacillota bacterium]